jgi:putative hydrolase of the HAD superfamily
VSAVTFDYGQTLAELDLEMLARRLAERGGTLDPARGRAATASAWEAYGRAKRNGQEGQVAWCTFMRALLCGSGIDEREAAGHAEWLWSEQPKRNLWRKPLPGMFELARELKQHGLAVGIVSNSEGKLAELLHELGEAPTFAVIADSGVLGIEKPDPRIFEFAAKALGVTTRDIVHVGDSWEADVEGALRSGGRAIWFQPEPAESRELSANVRVASDAESVRAALSEFGLPA